MNIEVKHVYEYTTVTDTNLVTFDCEVEQMMNKGWKLSGNAYMQPFTQTSELTQVPVFFQPMIRRAWHDDGDDIYDDNDRLIERKSEMAGTLKRTIKVEDLSIGESTRETV